MSPLQDSQQVPEFAGEEFFFVSQVCKEKGQSVHLGKMGTMPAGNQRTAKVADLDGPGLTLSISNRKRGRWGSWLHNPPAVGSQVGHTKLSSLSCFFCKMGMICAML